jgi:hypothetical protein
VGCINAFKISGQERAGELLDAQPVGFAFTSVGYLALLDDLAYTLAAGADPIFLSRTERKTLDRVAKLPKHRLGSLKLLFEGGDRLIEPIASEVPVKGERVMLSDMHHGFVVDEAELHVVTEDGTSTIDLPGCSELEVVTNSRHCVRRHGCTSASAFMTVQNIGCPTPSRRIELPYRSGLHAYGDDHLDARISVESIEGGGQLDVLRVRVASRMKQADE